MHAIPFSSWIGAVVTMVTELTQGSNFGLWINSKEAMCALCKSFNFLLNWNSSCHGNGKSQNKGNPEFCDLCKSV